jgi:hypothetical protein
MTLWDQLSAMCLTTPPAGAIVAAREAHSGSPGVVAATVLGIASGVGGVWLMNRVLDAVVCRTRHLSERQQSRYGVALYAVVLVWIAVLASLASAVTSAFLRRI